MGTKHVMWVRGLAMLMLGCAVVIAGALAGRTTAQEGLPDRAALEPGWNWLAPGGETTCSDGSPYQFAVREGAGDDLLIYFEGGGACWSGLTCGPLNRTFQPAIATEYPSDAVDGIFNFDNPANPFADYDVVVIKYCTGDVFIGDATAHYGTGANAVTIEHRGFADAAAALDWTTANYPAPASVFVTGESAGALGASFHAPFVIRAYPGARVAMLGDSAGGYSVPEIDPGFLYEAWGTAALLPEWMPEADETSIEDVTFESFYVTAAQQAPDVTFAQINLLSDETQAFFLSLVAPGAALEEVLPASMARIAAAVPNFRVYLAEGTTHTLLHRPEFYTFAAGGVPVRDWVAALAAGDPAPDVVCAACAVDEGGS